MRIAGSGRVIFAATLIGFGILGLFNKDYAAVWSSLPDIVPARQMLNPLCALLLLACGIGLLLQQAASSAARVLLAYLLLWSLLVSLPGIVAAHAALGSWYGLAEPAVMVAAAWTLYARLASPWDRRHLKFATGANGVKIARVLYALALLYFGVGHIVFIRETASDVPTWLPWHTAWAYLTGCAFIAAALAILTGIFARMAATLTASQIGLFVLLVWVPLLVGAPRHSAFLWRESLVSAALTAGAWALADSYRGSR